ncbi:hypothetical protein Ancab_024472 [Ancistrocladus abbreviatus]
MSTARFMLGNIWFPKRIHDSEMVLHMIIPIILWLSVPTEALAAPLTMAKKGCPERCANVTIPYPFGIGAECYYNQWYAITCNSSFNPPRPFLAAFPLELLQATLYPKTLRVNIPRVFYCTKGNTAWTSANLDGSPYIFSKDDNIFTPAGCGGSSLSYSHDKIIARCASGCDDNDYHTYYVGGQYLQSCETSCGLVAFWAGPRRGKARGPKVTAEVQIRNGVVFTSGMGGGATSNHITLNAAVHALITAGCQVGEG